MTLICEKCDKEFKDGYSLYTDREALAGFKKRYPNYPVDEEEHYICESCYQQAMKATLQ